MSASAKKVTIYWFRNALRFHDNPSLLAACSTFQTPKQQQAGRINPYKTSSYTNNNNDDEDDTHYLLPIYIIDNQTSTPFAQTPYRIVGVNRARFVLESLRELKDGFKARNSSLLCFLGSPDVILPELIHLLQQPSSSSSDANTHTSVRLVFEQECAAPIREMDTAVIQAIRDKEEKSNKVTKTPPVLIQSFDTHSLFEMERYVSKCKNSVAPSTMGAFGKIFRSMGNVPDEVEDVNTVPALPEGLDALKKLSNNFSQGLNEFDIPSLVHLGYLDDDDSSSSNTTKRTSSTFPGGETEALKRLDRMMARKQWVCEFEKPKTKPNALECDTTGLSMYVKHGCVSARRFYHRLSRIYDEASKHSEPPVSLHGQLIWREFNYLTGYTTPNFDKMEGNPVARNIPWGDDVELLEAWKNARTGYPFIDAVMTELNETGWIHHLARHAVACFLTRGDFWQSWEEGAAYFEEKLLDADWSINNFNWQWLSCTAHFYQYFRCYSPVAFGKKTDPLGLYIRKWLPQFENCPDKYIYEPWKNKKAVEAACGIKLGIDYPLPLVDHAVVSKQNMEKMSEAYEAYKNQQTVTTSGRRAASNNTSTSKSSSQKRQKTK